MSFGILFVYFSLSRMILFLQLLQAFSAQHPTFLVSDIRLYSIRFNPIGSKVLSGTFGRDVGRPRAIRRKGMRDDRSLYIRAQAKNRSS